MRVALVAKLVTSGIQVFYLQYFLSWHHIHLFLTASFFTKKLSLLKSKGTGSNLSTSNLSTLLFKLLKLHFLVYQYLIYLHQILNLNQLFFAKSDVATPRQI